MERKIERLQNELIELKTYWDVTPGEKNEIKYVTARQSPADPPMIFIPVSADGEIALDTIGLTQEMFDSSTVVLAFQDSDSSTVYYSFTEGLAKPSLDKPRTKYPNSYLQNNKKFLMMEALNASKRSTD